MSDKNVNEPNAETKSVKNKSKDKSPPLNAKEELSEFFKTALIAVVLAMIIRTFLFEPFNIPSGSMKPTLLVGDYLFVNKPAYGYSRYSFPFGLGPIPQGQRVWSEAPKRGDVIVFKLPSNPRVDYIKRLIGLPGDRIQVRNGRLYLNGVETKREKTDTKLVQNEYRGEVMMHEYTQTLPDGTMFTIYEESDREVLDNTPVFTVPEGHYFMMGDNRDNSQDSRVAEIVGFVPHENLVGRADFLFFSTNGHARIYEPWKWPWSLRYSRFFMGLNPDRPVKD